MEGKNQEKKYSFFQHRECEYFPCHKVKKEEDFNCLFCYCPLYALGPDCGGNYSYTEKGIKDCTNCTLPHSKGGYEYVLSKFSEVAELAKKKDHIYHNMTEIIGNTPLMEVNHIQEKLGLKGRILVKLEGLNPAGSAKDRAAKFMIDDAEKKGILKEGAVIIEPTSGNTGIGLAAIAAVKGYRCIFTMPETMSVERINILKAYGAEIVLTEGALGMSGAIAKADELAREFQNSFIPGQFENPANADSHRATTGPEIWRDTDGNIDYFVAGVGTGGTITGVGEYLKVQNDQVKVIAVEPEDSPYLSKGVSVSHKIQGIGAGFKPELLNDKIYDAIMPVANDDAFAAAKLLAKEEGILVGISSGAALHAGIELAKKDENKGKTIVVLLPDHGDRYYSTPLFVES